MSKRLEKNQAIIQQLEADANAAAAAYVAEVDEYQRLYRLERMQDIVCDLTEWIESSGDEALLAELGVHVREDDGVVTLKQFHRAIEIRPRDDMTIAVAGKIMQPNRDCPVLDQPFYDEVMGRVFSWAREQDADKPRRDLR